MSLVGGLKILQTKTPIPTKRRLAGITKVNGSGTPKRAAVFHRETLVYLGSCKSASDGTWELEGMPELPVEKILVIILDDTRAFEPIAFDNISLEA